MLQLLKNDDPGIDVKRITKPATSVSDAEIIARIQAGDINAYGRIMRRYNQRLFRIARSFVTDASAAMDIVQESHIKAFLKLSEYRGDASFVVWLSSITRNESLMYLRKHKREVVMFDDKLPMEPGPGDESFRSLQERPEVCLENEQLKQLIDQHLDKLPIDYRCVFACRAIEQFSVRETADILGLREETVKTRYFRAKRMLRDNLQNWLDHAGMNIYEIGGQHCDDLVSNVLSRLHRQAAMKRNQ